MSFSLTNPPTKVAPGYARANTYNWNPGSQLLNWRLARSKVRGGLAGARAPIACVGDSTTAGVGANNGATPYRTLSYPARLTQAIQQRSGGLIPPTFQNFMSTGGDPACDTGRLTLIGNASYTGGAQGFGGSFIGTAAATDGVDFVPGGTATFDSVDVFWYSGSAAFTVSVNGGTKTTVTPSGSNIGKTTVSLGATYPGTATVNIRGAGANQTYIQGAACWNSTIPAVEVYNGGVGGTTSGSWNQTTGYGLFQGCLATKSALCIINLGINDLQGQSSPASIITQFVADTQTRVTALQAQNCDSIVVIPTPCGDGQTQTNFPLLKAALQPLAASMNFPIVDLTERYQSYAKANAAGTYYGTLHPNGLLYSDEGDFFADLILAA